MKKKLAGTAIERLHYALVCLLLVLVPVLGPVVRAGHADEHAGQKVDLRAQVGESGRDTGGGAAYRVATFDSGFGGYFTAKAIEMQARSLSERGCSPFTIMHYGDTLNLPYGTKLPDQIAALTASGVLTAFRDGAHDVFIACNTASTQIERVRQIIREKDPSYPNRVHSIIEVSVREVMKTVGSRLRTQNSVVVGLLATPATAMSETYPKSLARALNTGHRPSDCRKLTQPRRGGNPGDTVESVTCVTELTLGPKKKVTVYQVAPANWVEMIEHGTPDAERLAVVGSDVAALSALATSPGVFDVVGEFCTHYPAIDAEIRRVFRDAGMSGPDTRFIVQGPLMGELFARQYLDRKLSCLGSGTTTPVHARICLSGTNTSATADLVRRIFPGDPEPSITTCEFIRLP